MLSYLNKYVHFRIHNSPTPLSTLSVINSGETLHSILIKIQLDATVCSLIYFIAKSLYMFRVSQHPPSGVLKTVTAASGTGHNIGTATSLQRGLIGTWPRWREAAVTVFSAVDTRNM